MNNIQTVQGSIGAMAKLNNQSIAASFMQADVIVIVDTSASMGQRDSRGNNSRYEVACIELMDLQRTLPGKIAVFSFSHDTEFCPGGIPTNQDGSTNMTKALSFVKCADLPGMKFILISDGEPDEPEGTLVIARTFTNKIDTIYCGPENKPFGRDFLRKLSAATGGQSITSDRAKELAGSINQLLLSR